MSSSLHWVLYRLRYFHHTTPFETGLSDCHKLILTLVMAYFKKLDPKNTEYGNYKKVLTKIIFFTKLTKNLAKGLSISKKIVSMMSLEIFLEFFLDKYALIKEKIVRDNEGPFITKKLIKAIMNRSKFKK